MAEMSVKTIPIRLDMRGNTQIENITKRVQEAVAETGLQAGIATVFVRHTTASVMLIEDEPGIRADTKAIWDRLIPADARWEHNTRNPGEDNAHSHLRGNCKARREPSPLPTARRCLARGRRSSWGISTRGRGSPTSWSKWSASNPIHPSP